MEKRYCVRDSRIDEKTISLQETLFHNANGYIGVRGTLEEGCPEEFDTMRGMYINGIYDIAPMKQAEKLCNLIEEKETMLNVADTQTILSNFSGQRFSMFTGKVNAYERVLDMEAGTTTRNVKWEMPDKRIVDISITRMTSFAEKSLFTIDYQIHSEDFAGEVCIESLQKGLVKNYCNPHDPRLAGESHMHLKKKDGWMEGTKSYLVSETISSDLTIVSGVSHEVYVNEKKMDEILPEYIEEAHEMRVKFCIPMCPGDTIRIVKYTVFQDSIRRTDCREAVRACMDEVCRVGIADYYEKQKQYLKTFWENSELEIRGDKELNLSVCFNMYQLLQSAGTDGCSSIAAKGMSGEGYEGHYFWDTEMFMLPYFVLTNPGIAKALLEYRYKTLPQAEENAALLGHKKGALYPWRTIAGKECSGYYPSGTAQYHINGDIAYAVVLYYKATGDWQFIKEKGLEMLLQTSRLWMDVGNFYEGRFHIHCVTGPDEYTCMVNDNYYTNAAAKYNIEQFLKLTKQLAEEVEAWNTFCSVHKLTETELEEMEQAAERMYLPYDENLKINPQDDSFLKKPIWNLQETPQEKFPLLLHYHPLHLYRYQVCKQADTVLAHFLFPEYQSKETVENSFLYYEKITTHDSSLSTCVFSIVASVLGMREKAVRYLGDSAKMDLLNTHKNTKDGIHAANMGGCYMAIIYGFAGVSITENELILNPYVPETWEGYTFRISYRQSLLRVNVEKEKCTIEVLKGAPVQLEIYGEKKKAVPGKPLLIEK
ncbi:glycoside hydrolase family 65 protein [Mediterraneibacter massiliensis]|uniref:glycoside hydrolase family 65 protein n=1 Tax=Mediterraneibacter massiliensis TaxID=1720300 RepID=UPI0024ADBBF7|nr:glycosyl hydrolase family 65 protein [Mediterraneibacter massiliensis]